MFFFLFFFKTNLFKRRFGYNGDVDAVECSRYYKRGDTSVCNDDVTVS